jgi:hypothetical protein
MKGTSFRLSTLYSLVTWQLSAATAPGAEAQCPMTAVCIPKVLAYSVLTGVLSVVTLLSLLIVAAWIFRRPMKGRI